MFCDRPWPHSLRGIRSLSSKVPGRAWPTCSWHVGVTVNHEFFHHGRRPGQPVPTTRVPRSSQFFRDWLNSVRFIRYDAFAAGVVACRPEGTAGDSPRFITPGLRGTPAAKSAMKAPAMRDCAHFLGAFFLRAKSVFEVWSVVCAGRAHVFSGKLGCGFDSLQVH